MIGYHASWVVPISAPPIREGWVVVDRGRIVACGGPESGASSREDAPRIELGHVAVMPGLVNAHTHLELSYLRDRVPAGQAFLIWIRNLLAERRRYTDPNAPEILESIDSGIAEALRCGTALVGDISNTLVTPVRLSASPLAARVFYELLGFNVSDPGELVDRALQRLDAMQRDERVHLSLAAHAPYSVAPRLFEAIRLGMDVGRGPWSVHLAESKEESEFLLTGGGPWRTLLEELGVWDAAWTAPGTSPVQYLDDHGLLGDRMIAVHGVQASPLDLARLAARGTTLVTCPRSNARTGAGRPPVDAFYRSGVRVAVGTDSLASTPTLNLFAELAEMRALAPSVPAGRLLDSATREGARALALDDYGAIEPGRSARLIAVDVPTQTDDVEEYLVSGIEPEQIRWLEA